MPLPLSNLAIFWCVRFVHLTGSSVGEPAVCWAITRKNAASSPTIIATPISVRPQDGEFAAGATGCYQLIHACPIAALHHRSPTARRHNSTHHAPISILRVLYTDGNPSQTVFGEALHLLFNFGWVRLHLVNASVSPLLSLSLIASVSVLFNPCFLTFTIITKTILI